MDAAALSLNIDSSKVVQAANDLDRFATASDRAAASASKVNFGNQAGSIAKLVASVQSIDSKMSALINTLSKMQQAEKALAAANDNSAASMAKVGAAVAVADSHVIAYTQHLAGLTAAQRDANAHVLAYRDSLNRVADGANATSTAIKFTAREGLNASRQLADIGVTAAMGMSPFLIAVQQGPQLFDILQEKAIATGTSVSVVFRAAAASVAAALVPLLPFVAAIALVAAGLAALTAQANDDSGLKKYTTAMGYTKAEVEKLNSVTVTFGDTTKAVFQVGLENIASAFGLTTDGIAAAWKSALDWMVNAARAAMAGIYAAVAGTAVTMKNIWADAVSGNVSMDTLTRGYGQEYARAQRFMDDVAKKAQGNAKARQDAMATKMYDAPATPKGGKSDAEKLADIVRSAEAEIKAEQSRAAAVGLSARAAAELEQRTKLLNQIEKAKIPVTAAVTKEVDRLAAAYANVKIAADIATAIQSVTDGIDKQRTSINDQTNLIGLYGDELTRARIQMEALTAAQNALPRGEVLSVPDANRVSQAAGMSADDQILQDRNRRMEAVRKSAEDAAYAMDLERKGLMLTGAAAESYAFIAQSLNDAKRQGIELSPAEVAAIEAAGVAYGQARYAIDQQAQAIADAREVTKGFFSDWINGVREGGNIFRTFADSVINSLNRIIDKLLDKALTGFVDGMLSGGGSSGGGFFGSLMGSLGLGSGNNLGGVSASSQSYLDGVSATLGRGVWDGPSIIKNALGGAYGAAQRFANGGAFTNTIVNTPTLFRFANGAALGEMGEAGPEAIMPLKRGPNGALGVQASGGGASIRMGDVHNTYSLAGAIGPEGLMAAVKQGGEATYNQLKRDLQSLLQQLDMDGTLA